MTDATSPAGGISSPNDMSSLSSSGTFSTTFARNLVEDYAKNEHPSDTTSRVLGAFLDHLPLDSLEVIVDDIVNNSKDLQKLAMRYTSTILFPIRASGCRTPKAISACPVDLDDVDNIAAKTNLQRRDQTNLRANCLSRDNNRCLLTRTYDNRMAWEVLSDVERQNVVTGVTEAAHIIPFSLAAFDERDRRFKATTWEAIHHMFPSVRNFCIEDINDPHNALTMLSGLHDAFGRFELCLELTVSPPPPRSFIANVGKDDPESL